MQEHTRNKKLIGSMLLLALLGALLMTKGKEERNHTPTPELPFVLENVWLLETTQTNLLVLHDGEVHSYLLQQPLQTTLSNCIIDLVVEQGYVTKITGCR